MITLISAATGITVGEPSLVDLEGFRRLTKRETEVVRTESFRNLYGVGVPRLSSQDIR